MSIRFSRRDAITLGGSLLIASCAGNQSVDAIESPETWVPDSNKDRLIRAAMEKHQVPGVGIAVVDDGEFIWQGNYGVENIETGKVVDNETLFQAASLTKPLFGYVVLRLIDDGKIDLEERLVDTVRPADLADTEWNDQITVQNVLMHQTGLPNWRPSEDETALLEAAYEPGTAYSYSGEAFFWLQQVCEKKTGLGLHELVHQYLLEPAGLTDMSLLWLEDRADREVYGHIVTDDGDAALSSFQYAHVHGARLAEVANRWGRPMRTWRFQDLRDAHAEMRPHTHSAVADYPVWRFNRPGAGIINSASSLRTTPADYARFIALVMRNEGPAAISADLKEKMLSIQVPRSETGPNRPIGLSWSLQPVDGGVAFDHWGFNLGQHISSGLGDTSNRKGLVMMTNGSRGNAFMDEIGPVITGTNYWSYVGV
ncbi:MAG: serine hydrolase domain-containing protein [Pseudomonadota bacterium]